MTADKRRTDACLKACEGISTQNLEDNVSFLELARRYNVVLRERDALRAENEALAASLCGATYAHLIEDRDALRAKIAEMEKQEPVAWGAFYFGGKLNGKLYSQCDTEAQIDMYIADRHQSDDSNTFRKAPLYALPGAQPVPSVQDGWLRAIDEALVTAHIGVANAEDTYEQAKAKLDNLIGFHVDVATDPAVNGGYKLMPIEPTKEIYECFAAYDGSSYSNPFDFDNFRVDYGFALEAAPKAKP